MDGSKPHLRAEQITVLAARLDTQHCASKRAGESQGDLSRWLSPATIDFRAREKTGNTTPFSRARKSEHYEK